MLALGFEPHAYSPITRALTSLGRQQSPLGNTVYVRAAARVAERLHTAPALSVRGRSF